MNKIKFVRIKCKNCGAEVEKEDNYIYFICEVCNFITIRSLKN